MLDLYNKSQKLLTIKKNFVKQTFYTTLFVSVLMILISFRYQSFELTLSLSIGIIISFCSSFVLWRWINYIFNDLRPGAVTNSKPSSSIKSVAFARMSIGKMFVLGLVFFLIFRFLSINIFALFIGISVVQFVVLSMIASIVLVNMLNNVRGVNSGSEKHQSSEHDKGIHVKSESVSRTHYVQIAENAL